MPTGSTRSRRVLRDAVPPDLYQMVYDFLVSNKCMKSAGQLAKEKPIAINGNKYEGPKLLEVYRINVESRMAQRERARSRSRSPVPIVAGNDGSAVVEEMPMIIDEGTAVPGGGRVSPAHNVSNTGVHSGSESAGEFSSSAALNGSASGGHGERRRSAADTAGAATTTTTPTHGRRASVGNGAKPRHVAGQHIPTRYMEHVPSGQGYDPYAAKNSIRVGSSGVGNANGGGGNDISGTSRNAASEGLPLVVAVASTGTTNGSGAVTDTAHNPYSHSFIAAASGYRPSEQHHHDDVFDNTINSDGSGMRMPIKAPNSATKGTSGRFPLPVQQQQQHPQQQQQHIPHEHIIPQPDSGGVVLPDVAAPVAGLPSETDSIATLYGHTGQISCLSVIESGRLVFSGSEDTTVKVWDARTWQCVQTLHGHAGWVRCLYVGKTMTYSGGDDASIMVWDNSTLLCCATLVGHQGSIRAIEVADGVIFSGGQDMSIMMWDERSLQCIGTLSGHTGWVLALHVTWELLLSGSKDGTVKAWDVESRRCVATLSGHQSWVTSLATTDRFLFSGGDDRVIKAWDLDSLSFVATLVGHKSSVTALELNQDLNLLYSTSDDHSIRVWDPTTFHCLKSLDGHSGYVLAVAQKGLALYSGGQDHSIRVWAAGRGVVTQHRVLAYRQELQAQLAREEEERMRRRRQRIAERQEAERIPKERAERERAERAAERARKEAQTPTRWRYR